jgi:hypothetical protein
LVEPRHHVRRGVKSASEDALRKCESIYSPEAITVRPYWHPLGTRLAAPPMTPKEQAERAAVSLLATSKCPPAVAPFLAPRPLRVGPRSRNFAAPFHRKISFAIGRILRTPPAELPVRPGKHSGSARAAPERRTIYILDVLADPEYVYGTRKTLR